MSAFLPDPLGSLLLPLCIPLPSCFSFIVVLLLTIHTFSGLWRIALRSQLLTPVENCDLFLPSPISCHLQDGYLGLQVSFMTMEHIRETLGQKFMSHTWNQPEMLAPFIPVNYPNMLTVQGREI